MDGRVAVPAATAAAGRAVEATLEEEAGDGSEGGVGSDESGVGCRRQPPLGDGPETADGFGRESSHDLQYEVIGNCFRRHLLDFSFRAVRVL